MDPAFLECVIVLCPEVYRLTPGAGAGCGGIGATGAGQVRRRTHLRAAGRPFRVFLAGEFSRQRMLRIGCEVLWVVFEVAPARERHSAIPGLAAR